MTADEPMSTPDSAADATVGERESMHRDACPHGEFWVEWCGTCLPVTPPADDANRAPVSGGLDEAERESLARALVDTDPEPCDPFEYDAAKYYREFAHNILRSDWLADREREAAERAGERIARAIEARAVAAERQRKAATSAAAHDASDEHAWAFHRAARIARAEARP